MQLDEETTEMEITLDELKRHVDDSMARSVTGFDEESRRKRRDTDFHMSMEFGKEAARLEKIVGKFEEGINTIENELNEARSMWASTGQLFGTYYRNSNEDVGTSKPAFLRTEKDSSESDAEQSDVSESESDESDSGSSSEDDSTSSEDESEARSVSRGRSKGLTGLGAKLDKKIQHDRLKASSTGPTSTKSEGMRRRLQKLSNSRHATASLGGRKSASFRERSRSLSSIGEKQKKSSVRASSVGSNRYSRRKRSLRDDSSDGKSKSSSKSGKKSSKSSSSKSSKSVKSSKSSSSKSSKSVKSSKSLSSKSLSSKSSKSVKSSKSSRSLSSKDSRRSKKEAEKKKSEKNDKKEGKSSSKKSEKKEEKKSKSEGKKSSSKSDKESKKKSSSGKHSSSKSSKKSSSKSSKKSSSKKER